MADPINATAILAQANAQAVQDAAPTDQSLNAGALLPDEPIPDVLTNEVEADASVLREMLPKLSEEQTIAQESHYTELAYLRADLTAQRGMDQRLATQALAVLPNFGKGRPVNYYSKHPSQTGYQVALEEIDAAMAGDVVAQLEAASQRLTSDLLSEEFLTQKLDYARRTQQVSMQSYMVRDFKETAVRNGFTWDDACFQGCAVDPSQNASVPMTLTADKAHAYAFADMDSYYMLTLQMPALLEMMIGYMDEWDQAFQDQIEAFPNGGVKAVPIKVPSIAFFGNKTVAITAAHELFRDALDERNQEFEPRDTHSLVAAVGEAMYQSKGEDTIDMLRQYHQRASELGGTLKNVAAALSGQDGNNAELQKMAELFKFAVDGLHRNVVAVYSWLVSANLATTYAGRLAQSVVLHAWKSVQQCVTTMQMPEADLAALKYTAEDITAANKTVGA